MCVLVFCWYGPPRHGWFSIKADKPQLINLSSHCLLLLSPLSTQKTIQSFRSWPNTSLMSFWIRRTHKSRSYSRRIKVKKHSVMLLVWPVFYILLNIHNFLCRAVVVSWRTPVRTRVDHGSIPQTDASADDGKKRAGRQTCAQSPWRPCKSTPGFFLHSYSSQYFIGHDKPVINVCVWFSRKCRASWSGYARWAR